MLRIKYGRFGNSRRLSWMMRSAAWLVFSVAWLLAPGCCAAGTASGEVIAMAVKQAVREYAIANDLEMEITVPHARDMEVRGCEFPKVTAMLTSDVIRGRMSPVRVELQDENGQFLKRAHFVAHVKVFAEAVVALHDIERGDSLAVDDLAVQRVDVSGIHDFYSDTGGLEEYCAKSSIKKGELLRARALRPIPLICRGDRVAVKAVVGNVEIFSEGIARQDGGRGESIRVYHETTRSSLVCRVLDRKTVIVEKERN